MRVVAGTARGRRLHAPPGQSVRPTSDRVREAIFSMLASRGGIDGAAVLDLFAGSGALGIEALSRGAATVTFVDHDARALDVVRANLTATGFADHPDVHVVRADARRFLEQRRTDDGDDGAAAFDVALLDPPYAFDEWRALLGALRAGLVVTESDAAPNLPDGWDVLGHKRYGGTLVTLARPPASPRTDPTP